MIRINTHTCHNNYFIQYACTEIDTSTRAPARSWKRLKLKCSSSAVGMWSWELEQHWDIHCRWQSWMIYSINLWTTLNVSAAVWFLVRHATELVLSGTQIHQWSCTIAYSLFHAYPLITLTYVFRIKRRPNTKQVPPPHITSSLWLKFATNAILPLLIKSTRSYTFVKVLIYLSIFTAQQLYPMECSPQIC